MKKRFFWALLTLCMIVSSVTLTSAQNIEKTQGEVLSTEQNELYAERQGRSLTTYFAVKDELVNDKDTYGGIYIDDDGNLNIMVVNPQMENSLSEKTSQDYRTVKDYQNIILPHKADHQKIIYRIVSYSLEFLETIQNNLMDNSEDLDIVSTYIDETRNIIVVGYSSENFDKNKVIDFVDIEDILEFEKVDSIEEQTVIKNGSKVFLDDNSHFSIACGAKKGNAYGFITAGHCGDIGSKVYYNLKYIGTITDKVQGGNSDAAFIERASSTYQSTTAFIDRTAYRAGMDKYGDGAIYASGGMPVGTSITAYGSTTGGSDGKIISTNLSGKKDGIYYSNLVLTNCFVAPGDSGGAIKAKHTYNGITTPYLSGIISMGYINNEGTKLVYTDINYARYSLGFIPYYDTTGVK